MNLAKISANGQITVPGEIRRLLGLKSGDKILFFQKPNSEIVINNASAHALYNAQRAFVGVAEDMGVYNDDFDFGYPFSAHLSCDNGNFCENCGRGSL
jgi:antitoxin PrlF